MRALKSCLITLIAAGLVQAAQACETPAAVAIPDGKSSTMEQMLAAQGQIKAYQTAMNEFLACIDAELTAQGDNATAEFTSLIDARHNAAIAEMEAVAAAFNEQIRAYRAANPAPAK